MPGHALVSNNNSFLGADPFHEESKREHLGKPPSLLPLATASWLLAAFRADTFCILGVGHFSLSLFAGCSTLASSSRNKARKARPFMHP